MTSEIEPLLVVEALSKTFTSRETSSWFNTRLRTVNAVREVSFTLNHGEVLGIVGESGSGKTTVARMLVRLIEPTSGKLRLNGRDLLSMSASDVREHVRPAMRMVFQDPDAALNPAYTIGTGLARAIQVQAGDRVISAEELERMVFELLERLDLDRTFADKYPDELSGGEKRRVGICRALSSSPDIIIADEPLSGLDVVLQERVLQLLKKEQTARGFALILVSHDLDRVNQVCDRVLVMHSGRVVEHITLQRSAAIRTQFRHPYSIMLQQARLGIGERTQGVLRHVADASAETGHFKRAGQEPDATACSFAAVCPKRIALGNPEACTTRVPESRVLGGDHLVACHFADELDGAENVVLPTGLSTADAAS